MTAAELEVKTDGLIYVDGILCADQEQAKQILSCSYPMPVVPVGSYPILNLQWEVQTWQMIGDDHPKKVAILSVKEETPVQKPNLIGLRKSSEYWREYNLNENDYSDKKSAYLAGFGNGFDEAAGQGFHFKKFSLMQEEPRSVASDRTEIPQSEQKDIDFTQSEGFNAQFEKMEGKDWYKEAYHGKSVDVTQFKSADVNKAARKFASEILGRPWRDILPDDTIVTGFKAGVEWASSQFKPQLPKGEQNQEEITLPDLKAFISHELGGYKIVHMGHAYNVIDRQFIHESDITALALELIQGYNITRKGSPIDK